MINLNEQNAKLVTDLNEFLKISLSTLNYVLQGMHLANELISKENGKNNISRIIDKISNVEEMISSFRIGIKTVKETDKLWLAWSNTGSQETYYYNEDNDLTEKMFNFILMSFDREISQRLSIIEESNNGYIYFCNSIKEHLHRIITEYMTA